MSAVGYLLRGAAVRPSADGFPAALEAFLGLLRADLAAARAAADPELVEELGRAILSASVCWSHAPGPKLGNPYWLEVADRRYLLEAVG